jgi:quinol monooxygenase YgiN
VSGFAAAIAAVDLAMSTTGCRGDVVACTFDGTRVERHVSRGFIMAKPALLAKLTAKEGQRDALLAVIADAGMKNVSGEPGTEIYAAHKDQADENVIWFYELYTDQASVESHGGSDGMKEVGKAMAPFMGGRPELIFLEATAAKGFEV